MNASTVFMFCMVTLLIFNFIYVSSTPQQLQIITIGAVVGFIAEILAIGIIGGVQIFGSGLNPASIRILFGVATLLNLLFQINIGGFPIGIGLLNNVFNIFSSGSDFLGLGLFIVTVLGLLTFVSGLLVIVGGVQA